MSFARTEILPGIWLDARLGVYFEALGVLAVADLHWGYAVSHRATGNLLPIWGDDEIADRLRGLIADYAPREVLWLGDSLHALEGGASAERFLRDSPTPVVVLAGNHDRRWHAATHVAVQRGGFFFHHGDVSTEIPPGLIEVVGHHHPAFGWSDGAGARVKLPSLVAAPNRLILPAFSPWAGGVPWNGALATKEKLWVIAPRRIFAVTGRTPRKSAAPA